MRTYTFDVIWGDRSYNLLHIEAEETNEAWEKLMIQVVGSIRKGSPYLRSVTLRDER